MSNHNNSAQVAVVEETYEYPHWEKMSQAQKDHYLQVIREYSDCNDCNIVSLMNATGITLIIQYIAINHGCTEVLH